MSRGKVTKQRTPFGNQLISNMKKLNKATASYGYFSEQGTHDSSGMKYAELMHLHEVVGVVSGNGLVQRRPFEIALMRNTGTMSQEISKNLKGYLKGVYSLDGMLSQSAKFGVDITKAIFGDTSQLPSNRPATIAKKGRNEPLVDTGDLVNNMAYKTSVNKIARKP